MGLFGSIFGKTKQGPTTVSVRDTLFGDLPVEQWPPTNPVPDVFPWSVFQTARSQVAAGNHSAAINAWMQIVLQPDLEARHYLQAWHFLRKHGRQPPLEKAKQVLGVVIEVPMPKGLDLLAAYADHSARYYNFSGAGIVWEHPDGSLDSTIDQLIAASKIIVDKIGPWDKARPVPPPDGQSRLNFLTPSGLHFGQGPTAVLARDPMAGRVFQLGTVLMQALIAKTDKSKPPV